MHLLKLLPLIALLCGCSSPSEEVRPVSEVIGLTSPESAPPVFTHYSDIAPLLSQRNDTTYLVNFWATWCKPCLEELPLLQNLENESPDQPLRIILVSLDTEQAAISRIPAYLSDRGIDLPTVVLTDQGPEWMRELDEHWDGALPTSFVYRNDLRYVYRRAFLTLPDIKAAVAPLLSK